MTATRHRQATKNTQLMVEVLELIAQGVPTPEIARTLFIATGSVRSRIEALITWLGAHDRAHAVALGYQRGFLTLNQPQPVQERKPAPEPAVYGDHLLLHAVTGLATSTHLLGGALWTADHEPIGQPMSDTTTERCDLTDLLVDACGCPKHRGGRTPQEEADALADPSGAWHPALYQGRCAECGEPFQVGTPIRARRSPTPHWIADCCAEEAS